jgi:predicted Zn-dependent protease
MTVFNREFSRYLQAMLAVILINASHVLDAHAVCEEEIVNARKSMLEIHASWPLRPAADEMTRALHSFSMQFLNAAGLGKLRDWRFYIIRDKNPNAFSIGNGVILITEGMLNAVRNEAELKAVIAHEAAHYQANHFCRPRQEKKSWLQNLFSRSPPPSEKHQHGMLAQISDDDREAEADIIAINILARTGSNPRSALTLARRIAASNSRAHFHYQHRIGVIEEHLLRIGARQDRPIQPSEDFQKIKSELRR